MILAALKSRLDSDTNVAPTLGGRIYPGELPQNATFPAARWNIISDVSDFHHGGPTALRSARIQIDVVGPSMDDAYALARLIETSLSGYRGTLGVSPNQHVIQMIRCLGLDQMFAPDAGPPDNPRALHGVMADYIVWYEG